MRFLIDVVLSLVAGYTVAIGIVATAYILWVYLFPLVPIWLVTGAMLAVAAASVAAPMIPRRFQSRRWAKMIGRLSLIRFRAEPPATEKGSE